MVIVFFSQLHATHLLENPKQVLMRKLLLGAPKSNTVNSVRCYSTSSDSAVTAFTGNFVNVESNGFVSIHQHRYPEFKKLKDKGGQLFAAVDHIWFDDESSKYYRAIGPIKVNMSDPYTLPWRMIEEVELQQDFLAPNILISQSTLTNSPYEIVGQSHIDRKPYFSCGWLDVIFPQTNALKGLTYHGSAAAIDKNLLVTAAHNFLPTFLENKPNKDKVKAKSVHFLNLHSAGNHPSRLYFTPVASIHCFIHPKWEQNFDPCYDIAFMFLSESICMTSEVKEELLRLQILPTTLSDSVQIVDDPFGYNDMRSTTYKKPCTYQPDLMEVIYHKVNTQLDNSDNNIKMGNSGIVNIQARPYKWEDENNRCVKIKPDILPFLDNIITQHQSFLAAVDKLRIEQEVKRNVFVADQEEQLRNQGRTQGIEIGIEEGIKVGRAQGILEGELRVKKNFAIKLIVKGKMDDIEIAQETDLTIEQVRALRFFHKLIC
jgi:hypothetical protein